MHILEKRKHFDKVYVLPVPRTDLDAVEATFIRALMPEYNVMQKPSISTPELLQTSAVTPSATMLMLSS